MVGISRNHSNEETSEIFQGEQSTKDNALTPEAVSPREAVLVRTLGIL
jgi:hypothetical protein